MSICHEHEPCWSHVPACTHPCSHHAQSQIVETEVRLVHKEIAYDRQRVELQRDGTKSSAIPNPRVQRQEVQACSLLANLLELIDNALSAVSKQQKHQSTITVQLARGKDGWELTIEDNGHGMSGDTLAQVPCACCACHPWHVMLSSGGLSCGCMHLRMQSEQSSVRGYAVSAQS